MLNDPLIPPPPPPASAPPVTVPRTPNRRTVRAKHPAMSARILATGLAATGMLGLTAGYAIGQGADASSPALDNGQLSATDLQVAPLPGAAAAQPMENYPAPQAPRQRVIQVPLQPPSAAVAGNGAGSGNRAPAPTQQQSSGSH